MFANVQEGARKAVERLFTIFKVACSILPGKRLAHRLFAADLDDVQHTSQHVN
jgi:hypothetical protein